MGFKINKVYCFLLNYFILALFYIGIFHPIDAQNSINKNLSFLEGKIFHTNVVYEKCNNKKQIFNLINPIYDQDANKIYFTNVTTYVSERGNIETNDLFSISLNQENGLFSGYNVENTSMLFKEIWELNSMFAIGSKGNKIYFSKIKENYFKTKILIEIFSFINQREWSKGIEEIFVDEELNYENYKTFGYYNVSMGNINEDNEWLLISKVYQNNSLDIYMKEKNSNSLIELPEIINSKSYDEFAPSLKYINNKKVLFFSRLVNDSTKNYYIEWDNGTWNNLKEINLPTKSNFNAYLRFLSDTTGIYVTNTNNCSQIISFYLRDDTINRKPAKRYVDTTNTETPILDLFLIETIIDDENIYQENLKPDLVEAVEIIPIVSNNDQNNQNLADVENINRNIPFDPNNPNNRSPKYYSETFQFSMYFKLGSDAINSYYAKALLKMLQKFQNSKDNLYIILEGNTCDIGSNQYNMKISKKRAETIKNILSKIGIEENRIILNAYGEEYPRYPNDSEPNRALNRRVDIFLTQRNYVKNSN